MKHISDNLLGIYFMILGILFYTLSDVLIKNLLEVYPVSQIAFIRSIFRGIPLLIIILLKDKNLLFSKQYGLHLIRVFFGASSTIFFIMSLEEGGMTNVYVIGYSASLFIVLFSSIFLKEKVGLDRLIPVIVGMFGVYLAMQPRLESLVSMYILSPLLGVICGAMNRITIKKLSFTDHPLTITLYVNIGMFFATSTCISEWHTLDYASLKIFFFMGLLAVISQYLIASAIKKADASLLAHCDYSSFALVVLLDIFYWNKSPEWNVILGAALIIISNIIVIYKEKNGIRKSNKLN